MTLATAGTVALLICSLPAFPQDLRTGTAHMPRNGASAFVTNNAAATPSEPWRIIPNQSSELSSDSMDRIPVDRYHFDQGKADFRTDQTMLGGKTGAPALGLDGNTDATCYTIRSYVVARDSKDSDSPLPAGYSTCPRASRYHLKSAEGQQVSVER